MDQQQLLRSAKFFDITEISGEMEIPQRAQSCLKDNKLFKR